MNNKLEFVFVKRTFGLIIKIILGLLEWLLRGFLLFLPLGLYMLLLQLRTKAPAGSSLPVYINNNKSEWQFVYSGTILVMLEPNSLRDRYNNAINSINRFLNKYKFLLIFWGLILLTAVVIKAVL